MDGLKTLLALACIVFAGCAGNNKPEESNQNEPKDMTSIEKTVFGEVDGKEVYLFTFTNKKGSQLSITNYGGIVTSLKVPGRNGQLDDVALGFDSLQGYLDESPYFGAIVGRYANRIREGRFVLDGAEYRLATNNGPNHLHGGIRGFDKVVWEAEPFQSEDGNGLVLTYLSPDGEEGYPGNLEAQVVYRFTDKDELVIDYHATTDKPTPVNLSHHGYFNLAGTSGRDILNQVLYIDADRYTEVDETLIPTGNLQPVDGPMDFREPKKIGQDIEKVKGGYDHNYVLNNEGRFEKVAELFDPVSGRVMAVITSEPGLQFYSGNFLDGSITGKKGIVYTKHSGLCLETQHFPDSPNRPEFPDVILRPGEEYEYTTIYRFGVR